MSAFSDSILALKNVILIQERLERTREDVGVLSSDLMKLKTVVHEIDKRLYAVERLIDFSGRQARQRRIEE